jgi:hypothetical protein
MGASLAILGISALLTAKKVSDAKETARAQKAEARRQQRIASARALREKRIREAQLSAQAGAAGVSGSIISAPEQALETSLQSAITELARVTETQIEQFDIAADAAVSQAIGGFLSSLGTFAAGAGAPATEGIAEGAGVASIDIVSPTGVGSGIGGQ